MYQSINGPTYLSYPSMHLSILSIYLSIYLYVHHIYLFIYLYIRCNRIDMEVGVGMGSKVMKVFLLLVPLIALLMMVAYWTLYGSNSSLMEVMYSFNEWIKANSSISSSSSSSSSSSGGKGGNSFFSPVKRFKADATKII